MRDCAAVLVARFDRLKIDDAHDYAASAFSELSGRATGFRINTVLTTQHQVFLYDEGSGLTHAIPVIDLVRLLGPRPATAPAGKVVDLFSGQARA
jgi:hypothetical protein